MRRRIRSEGGFTLVEMLVAVGIMVTVTGAIFAVFAPTQGTFQAQAELSDLQQRLRVGVESVAKDLVMAGAGTYGGPAAGPLVNFFAPILPYRVGTAGADAPGTARSDAVTIVHVPATPAQTTIHDAMPSSSTEVTVNQQPGCPSGGDSCGFSDGMRVAIFDAAGFFDVFTVTSVASSVLHLRHRDGGGSWAYEAGAYIAQVSSDTYYFEATALQLRRFDGYQTDLPVVDNVVGLSFEYFGEPSAPALRRPLTDPQGPWTTYGPKPPAIDVDRGADSWPAGENCVFAVNGPNQVSRLASLGSPEAALVPLTQAMLTDGPWCPDPNALNRYDADLLRVRRVSVTLRVQTGAASLRGSASTASDALFRRGGTSLGGYRYVPDEEIRFDVTPRNLNFGR